MNFLTTGAKLNKAIDKQCAIFRQLGIEDSLAHAQAEEYVMRSYRSDVKRGLQAYAVFQEVAQELDVYRRSWFFITIRPDNSTDFMVFKAAVKRLVSRRCFKQFTLSFEQKGISVDELGTGAHVHIVADMAQRSKGEVIRDVFSTMKDCVRQEFIDVKASKTPQNIVDKYLVAYEADDGHKASTKEWDALWRQRVGLRPLYESVDDFDAEPPPVVIVDLTSPGGQQ